MWLFTFVLICLFFFLVFFSCYLLLFSFLVFFSCFLFLFSSPGFFSCFFFLFFFFFTVLFSRNTHKKRSIEAACVGRLLFKEITFFGLPDKSQFLKKKKKKKRKEKSVSPVSVFHNNLMDLCGWFFFGFYLSATTFSRCLLVIYSVSVKLSGWTLVVHSQACLGVLENDEVI